MQQPPSDVPTAPGVPVVTRTVEEILETLPEDLDERLDLLGKYQLWLEDLNQKNPENAYIKALLGLMFFQVATTREQLGASPADDGASVRDVVRPLQREAIKYFDAALASSELKTLIRAWSYYYRGLLSAETDAESSSSDYEKACELGYAKACEKIQKG